MRVVLDPKWENFLEPGLRRSEVLWSNRKLAGVYSSQFARVILISTTPPVDTVGRSANTIISSHSASSWCHCEKTRKASQLARACLTSWILSQATMNARVHSAMRYGSLQWLSPKGKLGDSLVTDSCVLESESIETAPLQFESWISRCKWRPTLHAQVHCFVDESSRMGAFWLQHRLDETSAGLCMVVHVKIPLHPSQPELRSCHNSSR